MVVRTFEEVGDLTGIKAACHAMAADSALGPRACPQPCVPAMQPHPCLGQRRLLSHFAFAMLAPPR